MISLSFLVSKQRISDKNHQIEVLEDQKNHANSVVYNWFEYMKAKAYNDIQLTELGENFVTNLSDLLDNNELFLYFSSRSCIKCVQEQLEIIGQGGSNFDRVIILAWYENIREYASLMELYDLKNKIYYINNHVSLSQNTHDIGPFYFKLNSDWKFYHFFCPVEGNEELTSQYLTSVFN